MILSPGITAARLCCEAYQSRVELISKIEGGVIYIAFSGTDDWWDWPSNLIPLRWQGIRLGWYLRALRLKPKVDLSLKSNTLPKDIHIVFTGHSMGGSMAQIFTFWYRYRVAACITFGAPRTLSGKNCRLILRHGIRCLRFRHGEDLVTQSVWSLLGLRHLGALIQLPDVNPSPWWFDRVADHDMQAHLTAIERRYASD